MHYKTDKMRGWLLGLAWLGLIFFAGCAPSRPVYTDWKSESEKWQAEGWGKAEWLGEPGPYQDFYFSKSDTASITTVFWRVNGTQSKKELSQKDRKYLILTFAKSNGDAFAAVFSREK